MRVGEREGSVEGEESQGSKVGSGRSVGGVGGGRSVNGILSERRRERGVGGYGNGNGGREMGKFEEDVGVDVGAVMEPRGVELQESYGMPGIGEVLGGRF